MHCRYFDTTRKGNHYSFLTSTVVGGRRPLPSEICAQNDPPFSKDADLDRFPLITRLNRKRQRKRSIMTNRKSTTSFPTSYRQSAYVPQRVAQEAIFVCFINKIQFQSNEVCYKVSLCENLQRKSCSITIPPSNGP